MRNLFKYYLKPWTDWGLIMPSQTVEALVEGGKASAGPPIGSSLGPLGVNVGQVVQDINKKTASFKGMQVPVKIIINMDDKSYEITVGTPPASSLIIKEAGIKKGAGNPALDKVADLKIQQVIKIAKMKEDALLGKTMKEKVREIVGTCNSMGVMVEGVKAIDALKLISEGKFDTEIKEERTELTEEELKNLEEEKKRLAEEMEKQRSQFETKAKEILKEMKGKDRSAIKAKMQDAKIPPKMIEELLPAEQTVKEGQKAAQPAAGKKK